jgi:hypothetical protein
LPTRAGSPQQHMPITVGPFCLTHPVNFPCGRKPEYPEETHDFWQSVDFYSFHMRTGFESHWESSHWDLNLRPQRWKASIQILWIYYGFSGAIVNFKVWISHFFPSVHALSVIRHSAVAWLASCFVSDNHSCSFIKQYLMNVINICSVVVLY